MDIHRTKARKVVTHYVLSENNLTSILAENKMASIKVVTSNSALLLPCVSETDCESD